jgi:hypothetical protein
MSWAQAGLELLSRLPGSQDSALPMEDAEGSNVTGEGLPPPTPEKRVQSSRGLGDTLLSCLLAVNCAICQPFISNDIC